MPVLSIIIPVHNAGDYLPGCIESICGQSFRDWELLLIDDGSTDDSGRLCDEYAAGDGRVKVLHTPNRGVSAARNRGLSIASGTWVGFVDADDLTAPQMYEKLISSADSLSDMVTCDLLLQYGRGTAPHCVWSAVEGDKIQTIRNFMRDGWGGMCMNKIYRRKFLVDNNIAFAEDLTYMEDTLFSLQCVVLGRDVRAVHECLYVYNRANAASATSTFSVKKEDDSLEAMRRQNVFLRNQGLGGLFVREQNWRALLCKSQMVFRLSGHRKFLIVFPEANSDIVGNPFIGPKLKFLMLLLVFRQRWLVVLLLKITKRVQ